MQFSCQGGILALIMSHEKLTNWFREVKRDFPWRGSPTPYEVWVSEIMLQQTRAEVVVDYYLSWMEKFPTLEALASSSEEIVIKAWEGLGYYSRARNLLKAARLIVEMGGFPDTREGLEKLPGIGPYTAGAILSFAFKKRGVALDGNVKRVASRLFYREEGLSEGVEAFLPEKEPHVAMEALIELGALICKKEPLCKECPLQGSCESYRLGEVTAFPKPKEKKKMIRLYRHLYCITNGEALFLQKGGEGKVMADLWQFPYIEVHEEMFHTPPPLMGMELLGYLDEEEHKFTKYQAFLRPLFLYSSTAPFQGEWVPIEEVKRLPFSSGHRRVLRNVYEGILERRSSSEHHP